MENLVKDFDKIVKNLEKRKKNLKQSYCDLVSNEKSRIEALIEEFKELPLENKAVEQIKPENGKLEETDIQKLEEIRQKAEENKIKIDSVKAIQLTFPNIDI